MPTTISSDLHIYNVNGPVYDLANVVTKSLHLGLRLDEAISRVTSVPAGTIKMADHVGTLVPGLESKLVGSSAGDTMSVDVEPEAGYGVRDEDLVINMPKERFSEIEDLSVGMQLEATMSDGEQIITIKEIGDDEVIVDANHPLAGMVLHFDIEIKEVREATAEELDHGHAHSHGHHHG